jgi:hypothetical protein
MSFDGVKIVFKKIIFVLAVLMISASVGNAAPDSKGTDFWLAFPGNAFCCGTPTLSLFITADVNTTGTVEIPGLAFSTPYAVTAGTVTTVGIPLGAHLTSSDVVEDKGIHVTAQAEVTVYGLNRIPSTTDAYLGLPTDILGKEYIVLGYKNVDVIEGTEFAIVGTSAGTTVTITPSVATGSHAVGVAYNIALDQGKTYQLINTGSAPNDLSGTIVTSDKPIAVFGGHNCANIPAGFFACDHVVEELPPTETWGKSFVTIPLATRLHGDTFRFLASTDGTQITVNGTLVATLNRGQLHERIIDGSAVITSNNPILVAQYSNSSSFDGVTSDPFMMLIPPFEQFLASYTVTTPASGFTNFINVAAPNAAVGALTLDGSAVPAGSFTAIGSSGFSGAKLSVTSGNHNLSGPLPFGAFMYGFASFDSYGYPGGLSLAPVARVTSVSLAPKTGTSQIGTQHCLTATVTDQNNAPLNGVRVDFNVTGANQTTGFVNTGTDGQAQFCYTGNNPGQDTIEASVGELFDTATKNWTGGEVNNTPPVADPQPNVTTLEDTPKTITLTGSDADGDSLTFITPSRTQHGTLSAPTPATNAQLSKARSQLKARLQKERKIRGSSASKLSRKELAALIQSTAANNVTYTPDANYNGPDSFTFKVNDGHAVSAPATVNITVTPVNDDPEIQSLGFERRDFPAPQYSTPGIAAVLKFLNVDGDDSVSLRVSLLKARNVPKGCGPDVIPSDEVSLFPFSEVVPLGDDPDSADPNRSEGELKTVEIGPQAMQVASDQGCQVTLQVTQFTVNRTGSPVSFSGSACIDSDSNEITTPCTSATATASSRQLRSSGALRKIAPPAVR